ncbi:MAG: DUF2007 domain-containing protein [Armatimonadetes bacterium]|nr:DUF2007 domain-containing protein [Armatimonadota bacterium]
MSDRDLESREGFEAVYDAKNEVSANIVKSALEDQGVPAVVRPLHTSWFDGMMVPAEGLWGQVLVPATDTERAEAILAEYGEVE